MRVTIVSMAVLGVVATVAAVPAAGQQDLWDARDLAVEGGAKAKEFRLLSDSGGSMLILQCLNQAVGSGFAFAESIEPTQRVTVRGVPGPQRNIAVRPIGDRALRIASGRGRDFLLRMLSSASSVSVDASGKRVRFQVFGSDTIVSQCIQQQDNGVGALKGGRLAGRPPMQTGGLAATRCRTSPTADACGGGNIPGW
ncbi:MAG: hypothetical protein F4018_18150 [Acidobacteria bacterium]|nr:hypothetical protein [Acidobacteriota bacterium]MYK90104.1 hypothetical protein [Acidobacteriota bacterium]